MPIDWQIARALWGLGLLTVFFVMIYVIFRDGWFRGAIGDRTPETDVEPKPQGEITEFPESLEEASAPSTVFMRLLIISYIIWAIGYVALFLMIKYGVIAPFPLTSAPYVPFGP
jgi:hypothetical protein